MILCFLLDMTLTSLLTHVRCRCSGRFLIEDPEKFLFACRSVNDDISYYKNMNRFSGILL